MQGRYQGGQEEDYDEDFDEDEDDYGMQGQYGEEEDEDDFDEDDEYGGRQTTMGRSRRGFGSMSTEQEHRLGGQNWDDQRYDMGRQQGQGGRSSQYESDYGSYGSSSQ